MSAPRFIGIDVAKDRLAVSEGGGVAWSVSNDPRGIAQRLPRLQEPEPALVVLEATGGYESAMAAALAADHIPLAAVNPRQVRGFARAAAS